MNVENGIHDAPYFVPQPSKWPIMGSLALFFITAGTAFGINNVSIGWYALGLGFLVLIGMLFGWFGDVIRESNHGDYGPQVDYSFRWGMSWFIFSEVMFFSAFFLARCFIRVWCRCPNSAGSPIPTIICGRCSTRSGPRCPAPRWRRIRRWKPSASPPSTPVCC